MHISISLQRTNIYYIYLCGNVNRCTMNMKKTFANVANISHKFSRIFPWEYYFVLQITRYTQNSCLPMNVTVEFIVIHGDKHSDPSVPMGIWNMADIRVWIIEIWLVEPWGVFIYQKRSLNVNVWNKLLPLTWVRCRMVWNLYGDFTLDLSVLVPYENTTNCITQAPIIISNAYDGKALRSLSRYSCAICFIKWAWE